VLTKLFKDNIESKNPATRLAAVKKLSAQSPDDQQKLQRVAWSDPADDVRVAAIENLQDPLSLAALLGDDPSITPAQDTSLRSPSRTVVEAAKYRLEQLLAEGFMDSTASARLAATGSREACVLIACHAADETSRSAVLIMLDQQQDLARVVAESRFHSTRAAAAEKLTDESILVATAQAVKERDKVVARGLQERVDVNRALAKQAEEHQTEIAHLTQSMQQLSQSVWSPQYAGQFLALEERWRGLDPAPSAEQKRHYESSRDSAAVLVEESKNRQMAKDFCSEALRTHTTLRQQLSSASMQDLDSVVKQIRQESVNAQASWRVSVATATPDQSTIKTYESSREALQADLQFCEKLLALQLHDLDIDKLDLAQSEKHLHKLVALIGDLDSVPESANPFLLDAAKIGRRLRSRGKQLSNEFDAKVKSVQKQLAGLAVAISDGKWSPANSLYGRIEKKIAGLQGHADHKSLADRLGRHKARLDELADWQNFAAKPKLEALCAQMEVLAGVPANEKHAPELVTAGSESEPEESPAPAIAEPVPVVPQPEPQAQAEVKDTNTVKESDVSADATAASNNASPSKAKPSKRKANSPAMAADDLNTRAAKIKELQNEWKSIGPSPVANELWDRFKAAADIAYEPIGEFRQGQQKEREKRVENKQKTCAELDAFLADVDWQEADWKLVEKTIRKAKTNWRNNRVQDRKPDKALEQRFSDLVAQFTEKLNVQYDANAQAKETLIEKVQKLSESDINQHVINQTRKLQNSWKQTGIMRRRQDQELWEKFNGFCRIIYKQHHTSEKKKVDSSVAHVKQARDLIRALKDLVKKAEIDDKKFNSIQEQFNALAEFPERDKKFLLRDFKQATEQYGRSKEKNQSQAVKAEWAELLRKSELCAQYENMLGGAPESNSQALDDLEHQWNETTATLPKSWEKKILRRKKAALSHIEKSTQFEFSESEQERRLICIKLEILTAKDTPQEDKQLRMEYQLENLQQGLGSAAVKDVKSEIKTLARL